MLDFKSSKRYCCDFLRKNDVSSRTFSSLVTIFLVADFSQVHWLFARLVIHGGSRSILPLGGDWILSAGA